MKKVNGNKKQIGITLTPKALKNLDKWVNYYYKKDGFKLTKSQVIEKILNEYSEEHAKKI